MDKSKGKIIVEQILDATIESTWEAITNLSKMRAWFFENIPAFNAKEGFKTQFPVYSGEKKFTHQWLILEVIPQKRITYQWSYAEYQGTGFVSFELFDQGGDTLLRVTNAGLDSFPDDIPEFTEESCEAGWNYFIKTRLKNYIDFNH